MASRRKSLFILTLLFTYGFIFYPFLSLFTRFYRSLPPPHDHSYSYSVTAPLPAPTYETGTWIKDSADNWDVEYLCSRSLQSLDQDAIYILVETPGLVDQGVALVARFAGYGGLGSPLCLLRPAGEGLIHSSVRRHDLPHPYPAPESVKASLRASPPRDLARTVLLLTPPRPVDGPRPDILHGCGVYRPSNTDILHIARETTGLSPLPPPTTCLDTVDFRAHKLRCSFYNVDAVALPVGVQQTRYSVRLESLVRFVRVLLPAAERPPYGVKGHVVVTNGNIFEYNSGLLLALVAGFTSTALPGLLAAGVEEASTKQRHLLARAPVFTVAILLAFPEEMQWFAPLIVLVMRIVSRGAAVGAVSTAGVWVPVGLITAIIHGSMDELTWYLRTSCLIGAFNCLLAFRNTSSEHTPGIVILLRKVKGIFKSKEKT